MSKKQKFQAKFEKQPEVESGYFLIPFNVQEVFGKKGGVKVKIKINNIEHRGYLMPQGDGTHCMGLKKELREKMKISYGDRINVTMEMDEEERVIDIPGEISAVLGKNKNAKNFFDSLSFTNRKEYIEWITGAKKGETRKERLKSIVEKLNSGKKNPYQK